MDDGAMIGRPDKLRRRGKGLGLVRLRVRDGAKERRRRLELDLREERAETLSELRIDERELRADRLVDCRRGLATDVTRTSSALAGSALTEEGRRLDASASEGTARPIRVGIVVDTGRAAFGIGPEPPATLRAPGRARWGVSGSLNPKSAPAGPNAVRGRRSRAWVVDTLR